MREAAQLFIDFVNETGSPHGFSASIATHAGTTA